MRQTEFFDGIMTREAFMVLRELRDKWTDFTEKGFRKHRDVC